MFFDYLTFYGRTYFKDNLLHFNFSASGFGFNFKSKFVQLEFTVEYENENYPYISLFLDGNRKDYKIDKNNQIINLEIDDLEFHTLKVLKRTEASVSKIALKKIIVEKIAQINENYDYNFLFYGDSITCGYGVLGSSESRGFKTSEESVIDSYAFKIANNFNAKLSVVAVSGYPIYRGIWNVDEPVKNIYEIIDKADYYPNTKLDDLPNFNMDSSIPDLIVINLGANDETWFNYDSTWINNNLTIEEMYDQLKLEANKLKMQIIEFIKKLRNIYSNAKIIYAIGMLKPHVVIKKAIDEAIDNLIASNEKDIYKFYFNMTNSNDVGANFHPGYGMHQEAAIELSEFIKKIM